MDLVNAAVGWVFPFRGLRGERGKKELGKRQKGKAKGKREEKNNE